MVYDKKRTIIVSDAGDICLWWLCATSGAYIVKVVTTAGRQEYLKLIKQ